MATTDWKQRVPLGRTGLQVSRMGLASGYGVPTAAIERAFHEYGINYFYLYFLRRGRMLAALNHLLRQHQDQLVVVLAKPVFGDFFLRSFVERWLRKLQIERVSVLLLPSVNKPPPPVLIDRAMALKEEGKVRYIGLSSHATEQGPAR